MRSFLKAPIALFLALVMLVISGPAFASVGIKVNGIDYGAATDINLGCGAGVGTQITGDGSAFNLMCSPNMAQAGLANGGAVSMVTSDLAVPVTYAFVRKAIPALAAGAFTQGTLANGIPGQILTFFITTVGASGTFTITPVTKTGFASVTFTAAKDTAVFIYINDTVGWILGPTSGSVTRNGT